MKAEKKIAVSFTTPDDPGTLGRVFSKLAGAGINVPALKAWSEGGKGQFRLITEDCDKAVELLKEDGFEPGTDEVVVVMADNKAGAAWAIGKKLGDAGVNIRHAFATSGVGGEGMLVLFTEDNDSAVAALS